MWLYIATVLTPGGKDVGIMVIGRTFFPIYPGLPFEFYTGFYMPEFYKCTYYCSKSLP